MTLQVSSLCEAFQRTAAVEPEAIALRTPGGAVKIPWSEYAGRVRRIAAGLAALGVGRGDTVALMMSNRPEFNLCDAAAIHLGATPFSVYNTSAPDQITHQLANADSRVVICEERFAGRVAAAASRGGKVEQVVCVDDRLDGAITLAQLEERGDPAFDFEAAWRAVGPDDVLTIIYTSGTTGPPKGVEITHANMLAELAAVAAVLPVRRGDRVTSYLPSAHVADRWFAHYQGMAFGVEVTCVADPRAVVAALPDIRPTLWGAVPRVLEKIKAALESRFKLEADPERKKAMRWAVDVGLRRVRAEQAAIRGDGPGPGADLLEEYARADALVLSKIRQQLGLDQVRWSIVGAAPTSTDVLEFFGAIGLPICELWGMSELSCCATVNPPERNKLGTVGLALPGVEVAVAEDDELLCRGPLLMRGYRKEPGKTAEAIDADGWMHTGDVAVIDEEGYVRIVDRKKELIINAAGKNMSPANIEAKLKSSSLLIGQAVAVGDRRPYNVALILLDPDACAAYARERGLESSSAAALAKDDGVQAAVAEGVRLANEQLSRVEQIKSFTILPVDWEPGGDELTPTMKLKRRPIAAKYAAEIEALYAEPSAPLELTAPPSVAAGAAR